MWPRWGGDAQASVSSVFPGCRGAREPRQGRSEGSRRALWGRTVRPHEPRPLRGLAPWSHQLRSKDVWGFGTVGQEEDGHVLTDSVCTEECVRRQSWCVGVTGTGSPGWAQGRGLGLPSPHSHPRCHLRALLDLRHGTCPALFGDQAPTPCRAPCGLPWALGELRGRDADGDQPQECRGPGEHQAVQPVAGCPGFRALRPSVPPGLSEAPGVGLMSTHCCFR